MTPSALVVTERLRPVKISVKMRKVKSVIYMGSEIKNYTRINARI
jgi:hypothetical protein